MHRLSLCDHVTLKLLLAGIMLIMYTYFIQFSYRSTRNDYATMRSVIR